MIKNIKIFSALIIGFLLSCYAASAAEHQENALKQSAISVLQEHRFNFNNQGMNYTIQTKLTPENFKNAITDGWRLTLLHSGDSTSSSYSTSTRTVNGGPPIVTESSSSPQSSQRNVYAIQDPNNMYIGALLVYPADSQPPINWWDPYIEGLLSGARGLETGANHAPTFAQQDMRNRAAEMKKTAEALKQIIQ